jgi:hypothetical protein
MELLWSYIHSAVPRKADSEHAQAKAECKRCWKSSCNRFAPPRHNRCCDLVLSCHVEVNHCGARSDHNNDALGAVAESELWCATCLFAV